LSALISKVFRSSRWGWNFHCENTSW